MVNIRRIIASMVVVFGLVLGLVAVPVPVHAKPNPSGCTGNLASFLGLKNWDACIQKDDKGVPQLDQLTDIWLVALVIVEDIVKLGGYLAAGYLIWGGFKYIKSQGDPGEITQARTIITNALLGLFIVLIAVAVVQFIAGAFG